MYATIDVYSNRRPVETNILSTLLGSTSGSDETGSVRDGDGAARVTGRRATAPVAAVGSMGENIDIMDVCAFPPLVPSPRPSLSRAASLRLPLPSSPPLLASPTFSL